MRSISASRPDARYGPFAMFLHWAVAALIAIAWILPHTRHFVGRTPIILELHRSIGMTVLLLVFLRAIWRFVSPPPPLPDGTANVIRWASHAGHAALYLLMIAIPVLGMLYTWSSGHDISFWGLVTLPAPFAQNDALRGSFIDLHAFTANAILILAGLHAVAALIHQYVFCDGLLDRMLPARFKSPRRTDILI